MEFVLIAENLGRINMITLYTSDTCGVCKVVKMKLAKKGIPYNNTTDISKLIDAGIKRLPVLELEDGTLVPAINDIKNWIDAQ